MNEGLIPKRYAKALFKVALERGDADALYATMDTLARSFAANPRLQETVANPFLADARKPPCCSQPQALPAVLTPTS